jgi:hypothetical protein
VRQNGGISSRRRDAVVEDAGERTPTSMKRSIREPKGSSLSRKDSAGCASVV